MVSADSLLQVNSIIIAGLFIFLTISSITNYPILFSQVQENQGITKIGKNIVSLIDRLTVLVIFFVLVSLFSISSIQILRDNMHSAKYLTKGGFIIILIVATALSILQFIYLQWGKQNIN